MSNVYRCKCGWQMGAMATRAIEAHKKSHEPTAPIDIDAVIDGAARGKRPPRTLNALERVEVFRRIMTMRPEEAFERLFRQPILEELETPRDHADEGEEVQ